MTSNCGHSRPQKGRITYRYNPFEIAVCGEPPERRAALMAGLAALYAGTHTIGHVIERGPQLEADTAERLGVNLVYGDGQHGLLYPSKLDEYLPPRPLLEVDLVLAECSADNELPKVVAVEDGLASEYRHVLAYVGDPASCPVLPSGARYLTTAQTLALKQVLDEHFDSMTRATRLNGLVLVGGKSTRMNRDKAALEYHGKPQALRCHELLSGVCDEVFISSRAEQASEPIYAGLRTIPDAFLGLGPMGGILSALQFDPAASWFVLACDLPFVTQAVLRHLVEARNPMKLATAYVSANDGYPEPLCAIYEPKSIHRLLGFLAMGYQCPRKVLINSDTWLVEPVDPHALDNVNRPEEFERAKDRLGVQRAAEVPVEFQ